MTKIIILSGILSASLMAADSSSTSQSVFDGIHTGLKNTSEWTQSHGLEVSFGVAAGATVFKDLGIDDEMKAAELSLPGLSASASQSILTPAFKLSATTWYRGVIGAEVGYARFGTSTIETNIRYAPPSDPTLILTGDSHDDISSSAIFVNFLAGYTFENKSRLYGKIGYSKITNTLESASNVSVNSGAPIQSSDSSTYKHSGINYGIGFSYPITDHFEINAESEIFNNKLSADADDKFNIALITVGARYKF